MRVRANAWRSLTGEALSQPSRPNEGGAARMCPGPALYRRACVWEAVFSVGSWKHSSCCREKGGGGGQGTSTGCFCAGPELLQSESPYRKKAGVISTVQRPRACTHVHGPQQNNTEASMSAQRCCSGSGLFRLKALCKE